jgi:hypothetical protein
MRCDADNVMFWPKFVHSSLALRHVQYVLVEKADLARLAFTFLSLVPVHKRQDVEYIE